MPCHALTSAFCTGLCPPSSKRSILQQSSHPLQGNCCCIISHRTLPLLYPVRSIRPVHFIKSGRNGLTRRWGDPPPSLSDGTTWRGWKVSCQSLMPGSCCCLLFALTISASWGRLHPLAICTPHRRRLQRRKPPHSQLWTPAAQDRGHCSPTLRPP